MHELWPALHDDSRRRCSGIMTRLTHTCNLLPSVVHHPGDGTCEAGEDEQATNTSYLQCVIQQQDSVGSAEEKKKKKSKSFQICRPTAYLANSFQICLCIKENEVRIQNYYHSLKTLTYMLWK